MGRPLAAALAVPPFAGVALNRLVPKLNPAAPPVLAAPPVAVLDALPVLELPLPELPKANGAGLEAPNANGGGAAAADGSGMPNGLTDVVGTGILLAMPPNDGAALAPKAKGVADALLLAAGGAVLVVLNPNGAGDDGCWAGDAVLPKANAEEDPLDAPNDGAGAADDPKANGLTADGVVLAEAALLPKKFEPVDEGTAPKDGGAALEADAPKGDDDPNDGVLEPNAGVVDPNEGVVVAAVGVVPNEGVVEDPKVGAVVVATPNGPALLPNVEAVVVVVAAPKDGCAPKVGAPNAGGAVVATGAPNAGVADGAPKTDEPKDGTGAVLVTDGAPKDGFAAAPKAEDDAVVVVVGTPNKDVAFVVDPNDGVATEVLVAKLGVIEDGLNVKPPGFGAAADVDVDTLKDPKDSGALVVDIDGAPNAGGATVEDVVPNAGGA